MSSLNPQHNQGGRNNPAHSPQPAPTTGAGPTGHYGANSPLNTTGSPGRPPKGPTFDEVLNKAADITTEANEFIRNSLLTKPKLNDPAQIKVLTEEFCARLQEICKLETDLQRRTGKSGQSILTERQRIRDANDNNPLYNDAGLERYLQAKLENYELMKKLADGREYQWLQDALKANPSLHRYLNILNKYKEPPPAPTNYLKEGVRFVGVLFIAFFDGFAGTMRPAGYSNILRSPTEEKDPKKKAASDQKKLQRAMDILGGLTLDSD